MQYSDPDSPYLSIVMTGRNDNYGGDFNNRMEKSLKCLVEYSERHDLQCEIIIVEWNPIPDEPPLYETINWPSTEDSTKIRVITVPHDIHHEHDNSNDIPLFEYHAKNVGIRRSKGEFVLITNPDIIFSEELIQYFSETKLASEAYYRIHRYDVKKSVKLFSTADDIERYCKENTYRVSQPPDGSDSVNLVGSNVEKVTKEAERLKRQIYRNMNVVRQSPKKIVQLANLSTLRRKISDLFDFNEYSKKEELLNNNESEWEIKENMPTSRDELYRGPAGDFILMSKENWMSIHGSPELNVNFGMDNHTVALAAAENLRQVILEGRLRIYHIDHDKSEREDRPADKYEKRKKTQEEILNGDNRVKNDRSWGLKNKDLESVVIE